jgi:phage tail sheath gpL-like
MATIPLIQGFTTQKNPGFFGETVYGAGSTGSGAAPMRVLLLGLMNVSGLLVPNGAPQQVIDDNAADLLAGQGSILASMCYGADRSGGAEVWIASPALPASSPAAATATLTVAGTWATGGTYRYTIGNEKRAVSISAAMTATQVVAAIAADATSRTRMPVTAANTAGVVTFTFRTISTDGNYQQIRQDVRDLPTGMTAVLAGATTLSTVSGGVFMTGGAGLPDYSTLLGVIGTNSWNRIAIAAQDATALGALKTSVDAAAGPTVGFLQHVVTASSGSNATAQGFTRTTLNDQRFQHLWGANHPTHPAILAAEHATQRAAIELASPLFNYDGYEIPGVGAQDLADAPSFSTITTCLDNGITPLQPTLDGRTLIVRGITTHCLTSGGAPDYSTLDVSDAWIPDFVRRGLRNLWTTKFLPGNPAIGPDDPNGKSPPAGLGTPSNWNAMVYAYLKSLEAGDNLPGPILVNVDAQKPQSFWDANNRRIVTVCPVSPAFVQHQIGVSVRSAA